VTVSDSGRGVQELVTSHFKNNLIHMKSKIESGIWLSVVMDVF